jgi:hypothetical protein
VHFGQHFDLENFAAEMPGDCRAFLSFVPWGQLLCASISERELLGTTLFRASYYCPRRRRISGSTGSSLAWPRILK